MSESTRIFKGIAAGLGYLSIPFFVLLLSNVSSCAGSSSEYCARNGSFACSIFYANFPYLLAGPVLLILGPLVLIWNIAKFREREEETTLDVCAVLIGIVSVVLHMYMWMADPSCGIK